MTEPINTKEARVLWRSIQGFSFYGSNEELFDVAKYLEKRGFLDLLTGRITDKGRQSLAAFVLHYKPEAA